MSHETITVRFPDHDSLHRLLYVDADNAPAAFYCEFSESITRHDIQAASCSTKLWYNVQNNITGEHTHCMIQYDRFTSAQTLTVGRA